MINKINKLMINIYTTTNEIIYLSGMCLGYDFVSLYDIVIYMQRVINDSKLCFFFLHTRLKNTVHSPPRSYQS